MLRLFFFVILFLSQAFSKDFYKGDSVVKEGVYAFYNYEFDQAVDILSDAREQYPDHPGVHLIWAASRWVRSQASSSIEETYNTLESDLLEIEPIYEDLVASFPSDPNYRLYQGSAMGLSARVTLGKKQWLKTLYRSYRGFSIIDKVAEDSPQIMDAKLPIGIIEYYASISNSFLKWTVSLYGLDASRESGLRKMSEAAEEGTWAWIEAKAILSNLYLWVEEEPILAYRYSKDLVENFPNNFYFNLLLLESMIRVDKFDESSAVIRDMEKISSNLTSRQREWYLPYLDYEKALLLFYKGQYSDALVLLNNTIISYTAELDIILGNAYLLQGMIYDIMDQRGKAKQSYHDCIVLDNFSSAMDRSKQYLKIPYQIN